MRDFILQSRKDLPDFCSRGRGGKAERFDGTLSGAQQCGRRRTRQPPRLEGKSLLAVRADPPNCDSTASTHTPRSSPRSSPRKHCNSRNRRTQGSIAQQTSSAAAAPWHMKHDAKASISGAATSIRSPHSSRAPKAARSSEDASTSTSQGYKPRSTRASAQSGPSGIGSRTI